ncbi:YkvA family protein [Bacillus cereus]|uniref:YkvA family protein n=1 Tax=Bacillus cereus TaxID=1396 RepID=UPI0036724D6C
MEKQTLWKKFKKSSVNLGKSSVYESIILFYTMKKKELVALSYYVLTIDFIPDIAAIIGIGLLDDVLAIAIAHKYVMRHADAEIREKSKLKMESLFTSAQA